MNPLDQARARARRAAIRRTLYAAYPQPVGLGLLRAALPDDLAASAEDVADALYYLHDREHVAAAGAATGAAATLWRLTADGCLKVEAADDYSPDRANRVRMLRTRVLQALDWSGRAGAGPQLIGTTLREDTDLDLSLHSITRALAYLTERGRAVAEGSVWRITADGLDYLAGEGQDDEGIARPTGWD